MTPTPAAPVIDLAELGGSDLAGGAAAIAATTEGQNLDGEGRRPVRCVRM